MAQDKKSTVGKTHVSDGKSKERVKELANKFKEKRPEDWESIPDIDLYMDQVLGFMVRQHIGLELNDEETLTSAMINNYIKSKILPRANGKKYNRDHIGYITAICLLKQVVGVKDAGVLLEEEMQSGDMSLFYSKYCDAIDREYSETAKKLESCKGSEDISELALEMAVSSYAQMLACQKLIDIMDSKE